MPNTFDENPFTTPQKIIKETIMLLQQLLRKEFLQKLPCEV